MKLYNLSELFWKKTKFVLLFILCTLLLLIIQTKFILKTPETRNAELLFEIAKYEEILATQAEYTETTKQIHESISTLEFNIHQVQKKDAIKKDILDAISLYKDNKMDSRYFFGVQTANVLQIYYSTKEEQSTVLINKDIILNNLNECKANI